MTAEQATIATLTAEVQRLRQAFGAYIHTTDQKREQRQADNAGLIATVVAMWGDASETTAARIIEAVREHDAAVKARPENVL